MSVLDLPQKEKDILFDYVSRNITDEILEEIILEWAVNHIVRNYNNDGSSEVSA